MLAPDDKAIVTSDRRIFLIGKRCKILRISGDIAEVEFEESIGRINRARVLLKDLRKVETT